MLGKYDKALFDAFFKRLKISQFAKSHIDSFNKFIEFDIHGIVKNTNPISVRHENISALVNITDVRVQPPHETIASSITNTKLAIYPSKCRIFNSSYMLNVWANYEFEINIFDDESDTIRTPVKIYSKDPILLGKIPCMVGCKYCHLYGLSEDELDSIGEDKYETGGYFIIDGNEYIIANQENKAENFIYISKDNKNDKHVVWIQSKIPNKYKYAYYTMVTINKKKEIMISVSISKENKVDIPMNIFFKAIGISTDKQIWDMIINASTDRMSDLTTHTFTYVDKDGLAVGDITTQKDALLYIGKKFKLSSRYHKMDKLSADSDILDRFSGKLLGVEFLPHIGGIEKLHEKTIFMGYMVRLAIDVVLGNINIQDRDNYGNKRIVTAGILYGQLFRHIYTPIVKKYLKKEINNEIKNFTNAQFSVVEEKYATLINRKYNSNKLTSMNKHIATGEWPAGGTNTSGNFNVKLSVSQQLSRITRLDTIMNLQMIKTPVKMTRGSQEMVETNRRKLHATHIGCVDGHDTPEGKKVGIVKYKTFMSIITNYVDSSILYDILSETKYIHVDVWEVGSIPSNSVISLCGIFINGNLAFFTKMCDIRNLYKNLVDLRRDGIINRMISIVPLYVRGELWIYTDSGRILRPLYIVGDGNKLHVTTAILKKVESGIYDWKWLLHNGIIEYISIHECEYSCLIAQNESYLSSINSYSHCMISPKCLADINILSIPFPDNNAGPRNLFQCSMGRQSIGTYAYNYENRLDTKSYISLRPQQPSVSTIGNEFTKYVDIPASCNILIAISTAEGANIEDGVVMNKKFIDSGGFDIYAITTVTMKLTSDAERFMKPNKTTTKMYKLWNSYDKIKPDGSPIIGSVVRKGDILIGAGRKISRTAREHSSRPGYEWVDFSRVYDNLDPGIIEKVVIFDNSSGNRTMKVRFRILRRLIVGDKIASVAAQKSVISQIKNAEDMPRTREGLIPDILFNPSAIIKRMTIGHNKNMSGGLIAASLMSIFDGTVFGGIDIRTDLIERLHSVGLKNADLFDMWDGVSGRKIKTKIAMGICTYQRLKHMVNEKMYARNRGFVNPKTHQPSHGRSKNGGLRIGEMERDSFISHGATATLNELFVNNSDAFTRWISETTKFPCVGNKRHIIYKDGAGDRNISKVRMPWTAHYLYSLLMGMGISVKFDLESPSSSSKTEKKRRVSKPTLTKFEKALVIGHRVTQLQNGRSQPFIRYSVWNPFEIANKELLAGKLNNITIERKLPNDQVEYWQIGELLIL